MNFDARIERYKSAFFPLDICSTFYCRFCATSLYLNQTCIVSTLKHFYIYHLFWNVFFPSSPSLSSVVVFFQSELLFQSMFLHPFLCVILKSTRFGVWAYMSSWLSLPLPSNRLQPIFRGCFQSDRIEIIFKCNTIYGE